MSGFDKVETAQKLRDILAKQTVKIIGEQTPRSMVGRVISVDPVKLRGMVWFPGDDAPIQVNFFAGSIPSSWQQKDQPTSSDPSLEQSSTSGHGSTVTVSRINGALYVTDILTGGQFAFRAEQMGMSLIAQQPSLGNDGTFPNVTVGDAGESMISVRVGMKDIDRNDAIVFGPFMRKDGGVPGGSTFDVSIWDNNGGGAKMYRFAIDPNETMRNGPAGDYSPRANNQWWRVIPEREVIGGFGDGTNDDAGSEAACDWDFDINTVATAYSTVGGVQKDAFWLRIVNRKPPIGGTPLPGLDMTVAIRTPAFQRVGGVDSEQTFVQYKVVSPPEISGILGFHNSAFWEAPGNYTIFDTFGRTVSSGWGSTFNSPYSNTPKGEPWTVLLGGSSEFGVDGEKAWSSNSAVNARKAMYIGNFYSDITCEAEIGFEKLPSNADSTHWVEAGIMLRYKDANNYISACVQAIYDGQVWFEVFKVVGGVKTTMLGDWIPNSNLPSGTRFVPGQTRIKIWVDIKGTSVTFVAWPSDFGDGIQRWRNYAQYKTTISDSVLQGASRIALYSDTPQAGTTINGGFPYKAYFHRMVIGGAPSTPGSRLFWPGKPWHNGPWRSSILGIAKDIQRSGLQTSGRFGVQVDASNNKCVYWEKPLHIGGVGAHRLGLVNGYFDVSMPAAGEFVTTYPDLDTRQVLAAGIPILANEALYVGIPPGADLIVDGKPYLFIVKDINKQQPDFVLPEWAVLIAARNFDGYFDPNNSKNYLVLPDVRLGNGQLFETPGRFPRDSTFMNSWQNFGAPFANFNVTRLDPTTVMLGGAVKHATVSQTAPIITLDEMDRPKVQKVFTVGSMSSGTVHGFSKIQIATNGQIAPIFHGTGGGASQLVLDGIIFKTDR